MKDDTIITDIIILGASLTTSPWFTWKDFVELESQIKVHDLSSRGAGNEYMVHALATCGVPLTPNVMVIAMLTNFDKFDWYVSGSKYHELQKEKHSPKPISDNSGFWCTGSWFPLEKEIYKNNFYDQDYFCSKTIQQILLLQQMCSQSGSKLLVLFDSPVWTMTEQAVNSVTPENLNDVDKIKKDFLSLPLSKFWAKQLDQDLLDITDNSLLGFCWKNQLLWYNEKYRCHPPSSSQWAFYTAVVKPRIQPFIQLTDVDLTNKIKKFDQAWKNY